MTGLHAYYQQVSDLAFKAWKLWMPQDSLDTYIGIAAGFVQRPNVLTLKSAIIGHETVVLLKVSPCFWLLTFWGLNPLRTVSLMQVGACLEKQPKKGTAQNAGDPWGGVIKIHNFH